MQEKKQLASFRVILIMGIVFLCAMGLFLFWLRASLHSVKPIDLPEKIESQQMPVWEIFSIEQGANMIVTGRCADAEKTIQRFETYIALSYVDGKAYRLPTRLVGSELYFDNSTFYAMAPTRSLPKGEAELVILFQSDDWDTAVYTGMMMTMTGGDDS